MAPPSLSVNLVYDYARQGVGASGISARSPGGRITPLWCRNPGAGPGFQQL